MKKILLLLTLAAVSSCQFFSQKETPQEEPSQVSDSLVQEETPLIFDAHQGFSAEDLPLEMKNILEADFNRAKQNAFPQKPLEKITDFFKVQELLKEAVTFERLGEEPEFSYGVRRIAFANGLIYETAQIIEAWFVAYFPTEDILLCGGEHTSDFSFHLKTGERTERVGNPDYISPSPSEKYRLNGYYTGNENHYFIQKQNNGWQKIIDLNDFFYEIKGKTFEYLDEIFWTDDQTFYAEIPEFDGENEISTYYQFKIKPIPAEPKLAFEGTETPLPLRVEINFDSNFYPLKEDMAKKLLLGLFPEAHSATFAHILPISPRYTSVIVSFDKGDMERFAVLFNLSKQGEIIDYLEVCYDEVAESASRAYSDIHKDKVIHAFVNEFSSDEPYLTEYAITPEGYFIEKSAPNP